jgi:hypothetical protein
MVILPETLSCSKVCGSQLMLANDNVDASLLE